jgi:hypothetical protein
MIDNALGVVVVVPLDVLVPLPVLVPPAGVDSA